MHRVLPSCDVQEERRHARKGLHVHICANKENVTTHQSRMTSYLIHKSDLSNAASKQLKDKMVHFVATDLRPFKAAEGAGFLDLCQTLVDMGVKYGHFDVQKNLPRRTIISRHVDSVINEVSVRVKQELRYAKFIALTSDSWTDDFRKISYIAVTASYFNSDLDLCSRTLNTLKNMILILQI